ncbi:hypothetical protein EV356DRAFT_309687 [Viridothelium virens]|uniref:Inhibitor I9 domain-containing protein n=1 Tax=Viridothelium virens TaxID=1048519 RepID=A0A6A6HLW6_VIRVR|nr:hypothetical protein EV356DRAFT_309687 [Viridothelium virens]
MTRIHCWRVSLINSFLIFRMVLSSITPAVSYSTYRAPYHPSSDPTRFPAIPDYYIVKLREGHELEDHFAYIGLDLSSMQEFGRIDGLSSYYGKFSYKVVHEKIRRDPGVLYVEEDTPVHLID